MNPFKLDLEYDKVLANIVDGLIHSKHKHLFLKRLLSHLQAANLESDIAVIRMVLETLIPDEDTAIRTTINHIIHEILLSANPAYLDDIQTLWLFFNLFSKDPHALAIRAEYFSIFGHEDEFAHEITKHDPLLALDPFIYLISHSNSEYYLNINNLPTAIPYILDKFYKILTIIRQKGIIGKDSEFARLSGDIFKYVYRIKQPAMIEQKYNLLIEFYHFISSAVYEESKNISAKTLLRILNGFSSGLSEPFDLPDGFEKMKIHVGVQNTANILYPEQLQVRNVEQFRTIAQFADITELLINNMDNLNIIDILCIDYSGLAEIDWEGVVNRRGADRFRKDVEKNLEKAKISGNVSIKGIDTLMKYISNKSRIVIGSIAGMKLDSQEFTKEEIEKHFASAVEVFPLDFLLNGNFNCDYTPLLKKYPQGVIGTAKSGLLKRISSYDLILSLNTEYDTASESSILGPINLPYDELYGVFAKMIKNKKKFGCLVLTIFVYRLRNEALNQLLKLDDNLELAYDFIFNNLFFEDFLVFLIKSALSHKNIFKCRDRIAQHILSIISSMDIKYSYYMIGPYFDENKQFYCETVSIPVLDSNLQMFFNIYKDIHRTIQEEIIYQVVRVGLYKGLDVKDGFQELPNIQIGKNQFIVEHILKSIEPTQIELPPMSVLASNRKKTMDVLVRYYFVCCSDLLEFDPTYFSLEGLKNAVNMILNHQSENHPVVSEYFQTINLTSKSLPEFSTNALIRFIDRDVLLGSKTFRNDRLAIYSPLISLISSELAGFMANTYSMSKLETNADDFIIFEMMTSLIADTKHVYWLLLSSSLYLTRGIYISLFIEDALISILSNNSSLPSLSSYLSICSADESFKLSFTLPSLFCSLLSTSQPDPSLLSRALSEMIKQKLLGVHFSYTLSSKSHIIRASYQLDSITHVSRILVPLSYPFGNAKFEFDYVAEKAHKLYLKLNELLRRTSRFTDIISIWKVNLDERLAGHSECFICYFIQEPKFRTFADFACANCKNVFHKRCIYEWVRSSHNMRCPLCRIEMNLY